MRRYYYLILVGLLVSVAVMSLFFVVSNTTMVSGSGPATGKPEQKMTIIPVHTSAGLPEPVTIIASPKPTVLSSPSLTVTPGPAEMYPYQISATALEQRVHELVNQQRTANNLDVLRFDPVLADIARKHSEDMAVQHYFAHTNPAGQNPTARGNAAGYTCRKNYNSYYSFGIAENLFRNNLYSSATFYSNRETVYHWNTPEAIAQVTVAGWMNSTGHRENILTPTFDREGIGIAIASEKVYITENFC